MSEFIVVDIEATCSGDYSVPKEEMETIEIGAVLSDGEKTLSEFQSFIRPVRHPKLTAFCSELTTITQEDVNNAETFPTVWMRFVNWWKPGALFCSWGRFDPRQLRQDCQYHGLDYQKWEYRDLSRWAKSATGRRNKRAVMASFGIEETGIRHRGIDDARNYVKMLPFLVGGSHESLR